MYPDKEELELAELEDIETILNDRSGGCCLFCFLAIVGIPLAVTIGVIALIV